MKLQLMALFAILFLVLPYSEGEASHEGPEGIASVSGSANSTESGPLGTFYLLEDGNICKEPYIPIATEELCTIAATSLDLIFDSAWDGPQDFPGCLLANDGRARVFFNLSPLANDGAVNSQYAGICKRAKGSQEDSSSEYDSYEVISYVRRTETKSSQNGNVDRARWKNEGETCSKDSDCKRPLICEAGIDVNDDGNICQKKRLGDTEGPCTDTVDCMENLACGKVNCGRHKKCCYRASDSDRLLHSGLKWEELDRARPCSRGSEIKSARECKKALKKLKYNIRNFKKKHSENALKGCIVGTKYNNYHTTFFNTHETGDDTHKKNYRSICNKEVPLENSNEAEDEDERVTANQCYECGDLGVPNTAWDKSSNFVSDKNPRECSAGYIIIARVCMCKGVRCHKTKFCSYEGRCKVEHRDTPRGKKPRHQHDTGCTTDARCGEGKGRCTSERTCKTGLVCGSNNACQRFGGGQPSGVTSGAAVVHISEPDLMKITIILFCSTIALFVIK